MACLLIVVMVAVAGTVMRAGILSAMETNPMICSYCQAKTYLPRVTLILGDTVRYFCSRDCLLAWLAPDHPQQHVVAYNPQPLCGCFANVTVRHDDSCPVSANR